MVRTIEVRAVCGDHEPAHGVRAHPAMRTPATLPCSSIKPVTGASICRWKPGNAFGFLAQEIEEVPLRHHCDEGRRSVEMREVADRPVAPGHAKLAPSGPGCAVAPGTASECRAGRGFPSSRGGPCHRENRERSPRASQAREPSIRPVRTADRPSSLPARRRRSRGRSRGQACVNVTKVTDSGAFCMTLRGSPQLASDASAQRCRIDVMTAARARPIPILEAGRHGLRRGHEPRVRDLRL